MVPAESCPECHFDGAEYDLRDALGTLRAAATMWRQGAEGVRETVLMTRPAPGVWSAAEHAAHSAEVAEAVEGLLRRTLEEDEAELPTLPGDRAPTVGDGFGAAMDRLEGHLRRLHDRAAALRSGPHSVWTRPARFGAQDVDAAWLLRHAIHDTTHHQHSAGRGLHRLGAGAPTQAGAVEQINVSNGGVPKLPVESASVGRRGLSGDRQTSRQHHGRPMQALCLWSTEIIEALRAEGHPIAAGCAGENITLSAIDWSTMRPGVQIRIGEALAEISVWAEPCKKNAGWFQNRDFNRMRHEVHPGWSRAYAWVREPGTVHTGDDVVVEP